MTLTVVTIYRPVILYMSTSTGALRINTSELENAKTKLLNHPNEGPVIIAGGFSNKQYLVYCATIRGDLPVKLCFIDGSVEAYDVEDPAHKAIIDECAVIMGRMVSNFTDSGHRGCRRRYI